MGRARELADTCFETSGAGAPVLLVHGLGLNRHMWQWQLPALEADHRVIRYDLLGHGESFQPVAPYSMEQMVAQIAGLLDYLDLERCALVGFSLGGLIVQSFALAHPDRVSALAILNAGHGRSDEERVGLLGRVQQVRDDGPAATVDAALERWFTADWARQHPEVLNQVRDWVLANDPQVYPEVYNLLAHGDIGLEESIRDIQCPTLVLTGDEDYGNSPAMAARMAERIPGARLEILAGLRHMALAEDPAQVNRILLDFLADAAVTR